MLRDYRHPETIRYGCSPTASLYLINDDAKVTHSDLESWIDFHRKQTNPPIFTQIRFLDGYEFRWNLKWFSYALERFKDASWFPQRHRILVDRALTALQVARLDTLVRFKSDTRKDLVTILRQARGFQCTMALEELQLKIHEPDFKGHAWRILVGVYQHQRSIKAI